MAEEEPAAGSGTGRSTGDGAQPKKRAVVMIHGMGDQSPMETLRSFVAAVWTSVPALGGTGKALTWSLRDRMSDNLELWRIATNADTTGVRTDFFEFYWADMMEDTRLSGVLAWFKRLFFRKASRVPPAVAAPWRFGLAGIVLAALVLMFLGWLGLDTITVADASSLWAMLPLAGVTAIVVIVWYLRRFVLIAVVGDAVRYLTAAPSNIGARTRIRLAGLKLLENLHANPQYDRIVIVTHSLGSVVGYDLVNFLWSQVNKDIHHPTSRKSRVLTAVETAGQDVLANGAAALPAFRKAQRDYFNEVRRLSRGAWKISDFVTLGSPLAHAHFLMVDDGLKLLDSERDAIAADWLQKWWKRLDERTKTVAALFRARAAQRELTLCPPITEKGNAFTYEPRPGSAFVVPHHAAPFAAVRWTNIYAPRKAILWGDVVGGEVAPLFGAGVKDVALEGAVAGDFIAHTHYWDVDRADDVHLKALRAAVNLLDEPEADLWEAFAQACDALPSGAPPAKPS